MPDDGRLSETGDGRLRRYAWLVRRYPAAFRAQFGSSMERDFADLIVERRSLVRPVLDTVGSVVKENLMDDTRRPLSARPFLAALLAAGFALPLLLLNHVVVFRIDPVFSWLRPGVHTGPFETAVLWSAIGLLLVGAIVALVPMLRARTNRWRLVPNVVVAGILVAGFALLAVAFGSELACLATTESKVCD